ncbi:MAG: hypothetical protein N2749_06800 [Clostridia bacterium]|nr:hypothetical protein [Clostridia bacterium]
MKQPYLVLIESEEVKRNKTKLNIPGIYNFLPHVYDALMKLPFYCGKLAEDDDINMIKIQDVFQFYIYDFPFKIRNIYSLMEIGSYADAVILYRSLIESFIFYKYYILRKDGHGLSKYILRESKKTLKDIFECVIPGYYNDIYSELCKFTHGNPLIQAIFRGNVSKDKPLKSNINNINIDWFSYIHNQLIPLIIGVTEMYKIVFPNNIIKNDEILIKDLEYVYKFINDDIDYRKEFFITQLPMINYYNKIIRMNLDTN